MLNSPLLPTSLGWNRLPPIRRGWRKNLMAPRPVIGLLLLTLGLGLWLGCGPTPIAPDDAPIPAVNRDPATVEGAGALSKTGDTLMKLTSTAFADRSMIPTKYTCESEGQELSPPLTWSGVPKEAKSLVLIVDDPDAPDPAAPRMTWVHWVLYNIPPDVDHLPEGISPESLPAGTLQGKNDWKRTGYGGPCPPIGRHRYFHKLYALDATLPDLHNPTKAQVEAAMQTHVIAQVELIGFYQKLK